MRKRNRAVCILLSFSILIGSVLLLSSCSGKDGNSSGDEAEASASLPDESAAAEAEEEAALAASTVKYTEKDLNTSYDAEKDGFIRFDTQITASDGVTVEGNIATVVKSGTYLVSGQSEDAQLRIELSERESVHLIFSGVSISCSFDAPVYVKSTSKLIITLEDGTENVLIDLSPAKDAAASDSSAEASDSGEAKADEPCAALFSEEDLTINGGGALTVRSENQSGIISKDVVKLIDAVISVEAKDRGIKGKDGIAVRNANIRIRSGGDGMKATNSTSSPLGFILIESGELQITAERDGIQAEGALTVNGGTLNLTVGGGSDAAESSGSRQKDSRTLSAGQTESESEISQKGLKAGSCILITGGTIAVDSCDDAIHTDGSCIIWGGELSLQTGDDGIHADKTLTVEDGTIRILKSYEGLEAAAIYIKGGYAEISAEDDGINAASKSAAQEFQEFPGEMPSDGFTQDSGEAPQDRKLFPSPDGDEALGFPDGKPDGQPGFPGNSSSGGALYISGGYCYINAKGDGLDSNGLIRMTGGTVLISGPEDNGNSAIDYDGSFTMDGGILIAAGSSGMVQQPGSDSAAYTVMASFTKQSAGTIVSLRTGDDKDIVTFAPAKAFDNLVVCTPDLKKGESYTLYAGGSCTGQSENGLYSGGEYTGGTALCTVTIENTCTVSGSAGNGFGGGGQGGGFPGRGDGKGPGGRR